MTAASRSRPRSDSPGNRITAASSRMAGSTLVVSIMSRIRLPGRAALWVLLAVAPCVQLASSLRWFPADLARVGWDADRRDDFAGGVREWQRLLRTVRQAAPPGLPVILAGDPPADQA